MGNLGLKKERIMLAHSITENNNGTKTNRFQIIMLCSYHKFCFGVVAEVDGVKNITPENAEGSGGSSVGSGGNSEYRGMRY